MRARDRALERDLIESAALAGSVPVIAARQLDRFADERSHPGGVRLTADWTREAAEEIADCANYLRWGLEEHRDGYLEGEAVASREYGRLMRALVRCVQLWHDLMTEAE